MKNLLAIALFAALPIVALADVAPIAPGSQAETVASTAADIFAVTNLKLGKYAYKIVSMDSALNGDIAATTIVLVGEGAVGGAAGFEASFQMTPVGELLAVRSARVEGGYIALTFSTLEGKLIKKQVRYDSARRVLLERTVR